MPFLEKLDAGGRLALLPASEVRQRLLNGVFCLPKDDVRDRVVLDARPPNAVERAEDRWVKSLGAMGQMQHFYLEPHQVVCRRSQRILPRFLSGTPKD